MNARNDRVLGRGLSALISGAGAGASAGGDAMAGMLGDRQAAMIRLDAIGLSPAQPRKLFKDNTLQELSDSIRQVGVLQPILVRRVGRNDAALVGLSERLDPDAPAGSSRLDFSLVAGERRVRAAHLAGVEEIPAIICSYEETEALKIALLENIQRDDLNVIEEAMAYQQLLDRYGATQEELSVMLGKSRSGVANVLRLLGLEQEIQDMLRDEQLSAGHAKVLLGVTDREARVRLARLCRNRGLSVRDCEARVRALQPSEAAPRKRRGRKSAVVETREVRALRERTESALGTPVSIERESDGKGQLLIRFFSDDDLIRVLAALGVDTDLS
jgi:ParB family chromosome partitioning protein